MSFRENKLWDTADTYADRTRREIFGTARAFRCFYPVLGLHLLKEYADGILHSECLVKCTNEGISAKMLHSRCC